MSETPGEAQVCNPYVGPRSFQKEDGTYFYGREVECDTIVSLVVAHRVLLLYSQSGAGKTSLLRVGVVPMLEREGFEILPAARVGGQVPRDLDAAAVTNVYVFNTLLSWVGFQDPESLVSQTLGAYLRQREQLVSDLGESVPRVIMFDQLEEIFTTHLERWQERQGFFEQLGSALQEDPNLRAVLILREDYLAQLDPFAQYLPERLRMKYRLELLRRDPALQAVKGPAGAVGCGFAEGVAEALIDDMMRIRVAEPAGEIVEVAGQYVEPVQLQVVCFQLWNSLPSEKTEITESDLQRFGDVDDFLSRYYDEGIREAVVKFGVKEEALRRWFEEVLITPEGIRSAVLRGATETRGVPNAAVDFLNNRYLIRAEARAGGVWYELTHDRLVAPILASNRAYWSAQAGNGARQAVRDHEAELQMEKVKPPETEQQEVTGSAHRAEEKKRIGILVIIAVALLVYALVITIALLVVLFR